MKNLKITVLSCLVFLAGCAAEEKQKTVIIEETIPIIEQVASSLKEDKATVIGFSVKPQRSTSCEEMFVEISVFNEQLNQWKSAIEFKIINNSKDAIGGPAMNKQLFLASLNQLEEFAISGMGCKPYQGKMSKNYQIYATFKPKYGKLNIIGTIEQNILAKGINIYDFKESTDMAKQLIAAEDPTLETYVVPAELDIKLWDKLEGKPLSPTEIMADKNGAKTFILYQLELQKRVDHIENLSEVFLNDIAKGNYKIASAIKARRLSLKLLDDQREDIYRFYDMLATGTNIGEAATYTELLTLHRNTSLQYEIGNLSGTKQSIGLTAYEKRIKTTEKSGNLKGLKSKSRIAELKARKPLRRAVTETEGPYLKVMYPFAKLRSVKSRERQVELTKNYLDALDELELFDAKRHVKRTVLAESNAATYMLFHKDMIKARRDYLMDLAERAHEEDYLMSKNYHTFKRIYTQTKENIDLLNVELFSAL